MPAHPRWLDDLRRVDEAVYDAVASTPTPALDRDLQAVSRAADYSRVWIAAAGVLALAGGPRGRRAAVHGLISVAATSATVNIAMKRLGRRPRPQLPGNQAAARRVRMPASLSFPSGHAASAFAFATGVGHAWPAAAVPMRACAAVVAYSRVHTGVHYPGDVVAGSLLGTMLAQLVTRPLDRLLSPMQQRDAQRLP